MRKQLRVGVLFGGRSAEHEVSLRSAATVMAAIDRSKYEIVPIKIEKGGRWVLPSAKEHPFLEELAENETRTVCLLHDPTSPGLLIGAGDGTWRHRGDEGRLDVVFPVLHGTFGEDGTVQGMLDLAGIPYVGAGTAASAVGMDKALMKSVFRQRGLPVVEDLVLRRLDWERSPEECIRRIDEALAYPLFVKPANLGSSVGVSKVKTRAEIPPAMGEALSYDRKVVVERGIDAREIEVSVLGNDEPQTSVPGEIIPSREFYSYEAKYVDDDSELVIPAPLRAETASRIRELALGAYQAVDAAGMARVDFLVDRVSGEIFVNELNTIPGFTSISMYPKLWEATGLPITALVEKLIGLALEKARERARLVTNYTEAGP